MSGEVYVIIKVKWGKKREKRRGWWSVGLWRWTLMSSMVVNSRCVVEVRESNKVCIENRIWFRQDTGQMRVAIKTD